MNLFRKYTFSWQQIGVFKLSLLTIGIMIGSISYEFFRANIISVIIIAVISTAYMMYVTLKVSLKQ